MRIALDVHGGDYGIRPNIEGALLFIKDSGAEVILVGDREKISAELKALGVHSSAEGIRVVGIE